MILVNPVTGHKRTIKVSYEKWTLFDSVESQSHNMS